MAMPSSLNAAATIEHAETRRAYRAKAVTLGHHADDLADDQIARHVIVAPAPCCERRDRARVNGRHKT